MSDGAASGGGVGGNDEARGIDFFTSSGAMRSTYLFNDNRSHSMPIFSKARGAVSTTANSGAGCDIFSMPKGAGGALYEDPHKQQQQQQPPPSGHGSHSSSGNLAAAASGTAAGGAPASLLQQRIESIQMARLRTAGDGLPAYSVPLNGHYESLKAQAQAQAQQQTPVSVEGLRTPQKNGEYPPPPPAISSTAHPSRSHYLNLSTEELMRRAQELIASTERAVQSPSGRANADSSHMSEAEQLMGDALGSRHRASSDRAFEEDTWDGGFFELQTANGRQNRCNYSYLLHSHREIT